MNTIDARGLACPQPLLLVKNAVDSGAAEIIVLVDNEVAKENISRLAKKCRYTLDCRDQAGDTLLTLNKA